MGGLNVNEIYESISGEAGMFPQGSWCTFVRLQGCNLLCSWCDTERAQLLVENTQLYDVEDIVKKCNTDRVLITGGEPLIQRNVTELIIALREAGKDVQVETNGTIPLPMMQINRSIGRLCWVIDYKTPSSGMALSSLPWENFTTIIEENVYYKFVIFDNADLRFFAERAELLLEHTKGAMLIISPAGANKSIMKECLQYIEAKVPSVLSKTIFSLQLHKIIDMP